MAEGLVRAMAGEGFEAQSTGTEKTSVNPLAIRVMAERGIDISRQTSKVFTGLITVCDDANERCPFVPGVQKRLHWSFEDPSRATGSEEERLATFRKVRDQLEARLAEWLRSL